MAEPTYVPAGRCRGCGYPMDPGVCPECGRACPDVSPAALGGWGAVVAGVAVGLAPLPASAAWVWAFRRVAGWAMGPRPAGFVKTQAMRDAWANTAWVGLGLFTALPLVLLMVMYTRREKGGWSRGGLGAMALGTFLCSWVLGWAWYALNMFPW